MYLCYSAFSKCILNFKCIYSLSKRESLYALCINYKSTTWPCDLPEISQAPPQRVWFDFLHDNKILIFVCRERNNERGFGIELRDIITEQIRASVPKRLRALSPALVFFFWRVVKAFKAHVSKTRNNKRFFFLLTLTWRTCTIQIYEWSSSYIFTWPCQNFHIKLILLCISPFNSRRVVSISLLAS